MAKSKLPALVQPEVKVTHDIVMLDKNDERSLVNLVPPKVKEAILRVAEENPEYLELNERYLHKVLEPSDSDDKVRLSFWKEYNRAQDFEQNMKMVNVYGLLMSNENFFLLLRDNKRVAWMIKPPEEYMISLEASLNHGKDNLNKLMKMKLFDEQGNLKKTEANIFIKAYELLDNRVKGAVVQKIEQKTASLHVHQKVGTTEEDAKLLEQLRKQQESIIEIAGGETSDTSDT